MLEILAAEIWYQQPVYVPVGYLLAGLVLALFVPANQLVGLMLEKLPGDYQLKIESKK